MKIALVTTGRFWLCDLARELDARGHEVALYSLVPRWRTRQFGLPDHCNRWLLPWVGPLFAAQRALGQGWAGRWMNDRLNDALDRVAAVALQRCDLLIAISGMFPRTRLAARRRFGAKVFIERGSRHILSQREILERLPRAAGAPPPVSDWAVEHELADYADADTIVVPARHVVQSFTERGVPTEKLFRNPYGVSLEMFPPTPAPTDRSPTVIMVGHWSYRKGADVLVEAWRRLEGVRLIHVGAVTDAPLPEGPGFSHHDPVDQAALREFYGRSHVMALASREEGLALVQPQALACGLDLVCTDRTGGEDLRAVLRPGETAIEVVPPDDARALAGALNVALVRAVARAGTRALVDETGAASLSWSGYGERYDRLLRERV